MNFVKFFSYIYFFLLNVSGIYADTIQKNCGEYLVSVKIINEKKLYKRQFFLYSQKGKKEQFLYKSQIGYGFDVACVKSKKNTYMMLFNEYCSGNACPEYAYGIFDLNKQQIIVIPQDEFEKNERKIKKILGYSPLDLDDEKDFFCCNNVM